MQQNTYQNREQISQTGRMVNRDPREVREIDNSYVQLEQKPRRRPVWLAPALCLLALVLTVGILGLTGGLSFTSVQKSLPTRAFTINGHGSLIVNDNSSTFHIHKGSTNQIIVQGREYAYGFTSGFNNIQVQYKQEGNTVTLNASEGLNILGDSGINFDITVPANLDVTIHGGSTDAEIANLDGRVDATTSSGNLNLTHISGPLNLSSSSGDIAITDEQGAVNAHTSSGNIQISQFTGQADLSASSGDITLDQASLSGQDHLQTRSGNILFSGRLDPRGSYQMETSSGDITLTLPSDSAFQLTTATSSGDINSAFNSSVAAHATLSLKTSSGDITLKKQ